MSPAFLTSPLPFSRHTLHPSITPSRPPIRVPFPLRARNTPRAQASSEPPDFVSGFSPETDADYEEVRVLSFGPARSDGSLLTLRPVRGGEHAFKMSVTHTQAESIRSAIVRERNKRKAASKDHSMLTRPATHDLFKNVMDICGAFVTKAAITHIQDEVFIASVWIRTGQDPPIHVDSRPSDAIALAIRNRAPLFLNKHLLNKWHVSVDAVARDAKHGLCECVFEYPEQMKSTRSIAHEIRGSPEHLTLAKLKMELDLAVRLERFAEACAIREQIASICPIDSLADRMQQALKEERYLDAAKLQDQITIWKARMRMWEKGNMSLEEFKNGPEEEQNQA